MSHHSMKFLQGFDIVVNSIPRYKLRTTSQEESLRPDKVRFLHEIDALFSLGVAKENANWKRKEKIKIVWWLIFYAEPIFRRGAAKIG